MSCSSFHTPQTCPGAWSGEWGSGPLPFGALCQYSHYLPISLLFPLPSLGNLFLIWRWGHLLFLTFFSQIFCLCLTSFMFPLEPKLLKLRCQENISLFSAFCNHISSLGH